MGDPKKPRKKYKTPRNPWRADQIAQELYLIGIYGLRNKRELWKIQTELSRLRKEARLLLAASFDFRAVKEPKLVSSLIKKGVISPNGTLDDFLNMTIENFLDRRLQTLVWKRGLAVNPHQSRQMISHGHILVKNSVLTIPGYIVRSDEEETVRIRDNSPILTSRTVKPI